MFYRIVINFAYFVLFCGWDFFRQSSSKEDLLIDVV